MSYKEYSDLSAEIKLIWLDDISRYDYVRESVITGSVKANQPRQGAERRIVGYTTVTGGRRSKEAQYDHRIFWLTCHDRGEDITKYSMTVQWRYKCDWAPGEPLTQYGATEYPVEAVDPRTVKIGVPGSHTPRSTGLLPIEQMKLHRQ